MGRILLIIALSFGMVAGFGHGIARIAGWRGHGPCAAYRGHPGWGHPGWRQGPDRPADRDRDCPCLRDRQPPAPVGPATPTPPK